VSELPEAPSSSFLSRPLDEESRSAMHWLLLLSAFASLRSGVFAASVQDPEQDGTCRSSAVDYVDSGSYLVSADTAGKFSYASEFEGKTRTLLEARFCS